MTFEQADGSKPNPLYEKGGGFRENCQTAVAVFEARLRGFNIQAKAFDKSNKFFKKLMNNPAKAFIDPVTRKHPEWLERDTFTSWQKGFEYIDKTIENNQPCNLMKTCYNMLWRYQMNRILDFANTELHRSFKFDGYKKLLDNWKGSTIYVVTSQEAEHSCIGMPVLIYDTKGKLEEVKSPREVFEIMKKSN